MMLLALLSVGVFVALLSWVLLGRGLRFWVDYSENLTQDAHRTMNASFLFMDLAQLRSVVLMCAGLLVGFLAWLGGHWWIAMPIAIALLAVPGYLLRILRVRRLTNFDRQLPDLVQALAGALRSGSAVQPALHHLVAQAEPPLSQEFGLMLREQRLGVGFEQALQQLHERIPTHACSLVVSSLTLAIRTGGNLADTLDGIAQTLRARQHWLERVRSLTAQGRMQSVIMAGLPPLLFAVLSVLEPEAMRLMWTTPVGWAVMAVICVLETAGIIWIRRVATIDV